MNTASRVGLILLAAGGSRRLGCPKQLLTMEGRTLLRRAAEAACRSSCHPVVVVLGAEFNRCNEELAGLPAKAVFNPHWAAGMAGSIRTGLDSLRQEEPEIEATVLCLCDQPRLTSFVLDALVCAGMTTGKPMVASEYNGALGAPALFRAALFADLRALRGDHGARQLFKRSPDDVTTVPFAGGEDDVDTMADFQRITTATARNV